MSRPTHAYCQQMLSPGSWCQRRAVAPDPRSPRTSSLCKYHLAAVTERDSTPSRVSAREPSKSVSNGGRGQ